MSEVRLIEDWREKWEERTANARPIVAVAEIDGKWIEVWALASNGTMATYQQSFLIPIPQPKKLRPWKREEVPVGSVVRSKTGEYVAVITGATSNYVYTTTCMAYEEILDRFVLHDLNPDGTWKPTEQCRPCGVEE